MAKEKEESKLTKIKIIDHTHTEDTSEVDPNDSWDRPDTSTTHNIVGFNVVDDDDYAHLHVSFTPEPGKNYYLLYVIYSTGDSFGYDEGCIEFIGLYQDHAVAEANAKAIRADYEKNEKNSEFSVTLQAENGNTFKLHTPWKGYFESLTNIEIKPIMFGASSY